MVTKQTILVAPALQNSSCNHPRYNNLTFWSTLSPGDVIQSLIVLLLTVGILLANLLLISVINSRRYTKYIHSQPRYLLTSLACNDLAMGLCVTPFAILPSLRNCWPYAEIVCQVQVISTSTVAPTYPGGRNLVREALRLGQIPESAFDICMASVTSSTFKQYDSGLKAWWRYCIDKKVDLFSYSIPIILDFLSFHFNKGASYGTLNSYRSAIAQILGPSIAQDFRVKRFFKGVFQLRPSKPKYSNTWDPCIVLNFVRELINDNITIEYLTYKLAILLALASGQRAQTLSLIEVCYIHKSKEGIIIKIPHRIKTSGKNRLQPNIELPFYTKDSKICVASTLLYYLDQTKNLRSKSIECNNLILTFKRPIHNASAQTISRWIKKIMQESGVDISQFSAHSTRHASTSAAFRKGITFDTIRLAAGWTSSSKTFASFYNRPLQNQFSFAKAVLDS